MTATRVRPAAGGLAFPPDARSLPLRALASRDLERGGVRALDLEGHERVLVVGMGAGAVLRRLMRRLPWGYVAGIDPSPTAVRLARWRNRRLVRSALMDLRSGDTRGLPWPQRRFDAVVCVGDIGLRGGPDDAFAELHRVTSPDGQLAIAVRGWALAGGTERRLVTALRDAGFVAVKVRPGSRLRRPAAVVTARAA